MRPSFVSLYNANRLTLVLCGLLGMLGALALHTPAAQAAYRFADYQGRPPIHVFGGAAKAPAGLSPTQIKAAYHLPSA